VRHLTSNPLVHILAAAMPMKECMMGLPAGDIPDFALIVAADGTAHASTNRAECDPRDGRKTPSSAMAELQSFIHAVAGGTGTGAPPRIACGVISKPE